jgi:hypothetical protein
MKKFKELIAKMSPEAQSRVETLSDELLRELEEEAKAEGPEAVRELEALREYFRQEGKELSKRVGPAK